MKLGIMQPYFFPYIGYFQLINAVDKFVVYDDVNYIKQGWINRNNILANGEKRLITLEVRGASSFKAINQVQVGGNRGKLVKTIAQSYAKAPFFAEAFPVIEKSIVCPEDGLADYLTTGLSNVAEYLQIKTEIIISSKIEKDNSLAGQDKVLHICRLLGADEYLNAIGGMELYSREEFSKNSINLKFIRTENVIYDQRIKTFLPNLSIIDALMFNSKEKVKIMLGEYVLV